MSWNFAAPAPWTALSDQDREQGHFSSDLCVIGGEQFFVRVLPACLRKLGFPPVQDAANGRTTDF